MTIRALFGRPELPMDEYNIRTEEEKRVRKNRRFNFRIYLLIWVGFFFYAVYSLFSATTIAQGVDRFMPLQVVAGIAALAVFVAGRSLSRRSKYRRASMAPTACTLVGLMLGAGVASLQLEPITDVPTPAQAFELPAAYQPIFVAL